jgi:hypothetical protein
MWLLKIKTSLRSFLEKEFASELKKVYQAFTKEEPLLKLKEHFLTIIACSNYFMLAYKMLKKNGLCLFEIGALQ